VDSRSEYADKTRQIALRTLPLSPHVQIRPSASSAVLFTG